MRHQIRIERDYRTKARVRPRFKVVLISQVGESVEVAGNLPRKAAETVFYAAAKAWRLGVTSSLAQIELCQLTAGPMPEE